jgi:hypothetical protein
MKKSFFYLLFVFVLLRSTVGQNNTVLLEKIKTDEVVLSGLIDNKYEISIYLRFNQYSEEHSGIYSLKGWYYYNNVKEKIPLVGIYDGDLTLYVFKEESQQERVLKLETSDAYNFWENIDRLKNLKNYGEKLHFSETDRNGEWMKDSRKLSLQLTNFDHPILDELEILRIHCFNTSKYVQLYALCEDRDFSIVNYKLDPDELRILLRFEYIPNGNANGMCGAGFETGYIQLNFDKSFNLTDIRREEIESCLKGIGNEELNSPDKSIRIFKVSRGDAINRVLVDEKNINIKVE